MIANLLEEIQTIQGACSAATTPREQIMLCLALRIAVDRAAVLSAVDTLLQRRVGDYVVPGDLDVLQRMMGKLKETGYVPAGPAVEARQWFEKLQQEAEEKLAELKREAGRL